MAGNNEIKNIFLSASIPLQERDPEYIETADIIAIRDAVIALTTVVLPSHRLIWGGHPSSISCNGKIEFEYSRTYNLISINVF